VQAQNSELAGKISPLKQNGGKFQIEKLAGNFFYLRMRNVSDFKILRETSGLFIGKESPATRRTTRSSAPPTTQPSSL
jgi:hypothetical protein